MPIAHPAAEWEAITAHTKTPKHLLESITAICAVPRGRPGRDRAFAQMGLLLIGPRQGERRRILMEPGSREGIDLQGVAGARPNHAVERRGTQRREALPQPVIMERDALEAGLEQGEHPTLLPAGPHLVERLMTIENRQEQGLHTTATRENRRRMWRAESIEERRHIELAYSPEHQRHVGHRTELLTRNCHEAPFLHVFREGVS
jgi:hypothetical protein